MRTRPSESDGKRGSGLEPAYSGFEGANMQQIRGTDPVAGVPCVRRRCVDFQRICSAL